MIEPTRQPLDVGVPGAKLQDHHLRRQAMVYIRQSHPQQVLENIESTARQYALVERAIAWGWLPERVIVIDEDQGQSGQSIATRLGFQRLLAEVSLDHGPAGAFKQEPTVSPRERGLSHSPTCLKLY